MAEQNDAEEEELSQELTEKLLHFQEITNIDDLEQCKRNLRQHGWNVESAVQSTFLGGTAPLQQSTSTAVVRADTPQVRRRNFGTISPPLPLRNISRTNVYRARSLVWPPQPQGFLEWSYYILVLPFHFTWTTLFGIARFFIRLFIPDPRTQVVSPLIDVQDFIKQYEESYGARHPTFFRGTYADAQSESKRQLRLLLIYLHDPDHNDTAEFCGNTLANNDVIELVEKNFLFWACSTEKPEGYRVSRAMRENTHPFMAAICLLQGKMTVVGRLEGPITPQEFMEQISAIIERFEPTLILARSERAERDMNQQIRNEQDEAYQKSLMLDKEKEKKKKEEKELRLKKEEELAEKQRKKEEAEEKHFRRKQSCKDLLLKEADASSSSAVKLIIKLPDGSRLTRVFLSTEPVKAVHDYIFSHDNAPRQFQVVKNFPRKVIPGCSTAEIIADEETTEPKKVETDIPGNDALKIDLESCKGLTIAQAGLQSSETLFVQTVDESDDEEGDSTDVK